MSDRYRKILLLAGETLRELALHNRWFHICAWALLVLVLGSRFLTEMPLGPAAPKLLFDLGQGAIMGLSGAVLIILLSYHLFNELDTGIAYGYLVRSVTRFDYLLSKMLGIWVAVILVVLLADIILAFLVAFEVLEFEETGSQVVSPGLWAWLQLFLLQASHLLVLASLTVCLVCLSTSFLFAVLTSMIVWLAGLLLKGAVEQSDFVSGIFAYVAKIARLLIPRFEIWDISSTIWYSGPLPGGQLLISLLVAFIYVGILTAAGVAFFHHRDL